MRDAFHEDLDRISDRLVEMTRLAGSAMTRATTSLLDADLAAAEGVIAEDRRLDEIRDLIDDLAVDLLARQQPVATDLRIVVTALHMASSLERMGDLAEHVAKVTRLRYPACAVPEEAREIFTRMGEVATRLSTRTGAIIADKDTQAASSLAADDDLMDELHRSVFSMLTAESWNAPTQTSIDLTLLSRYYERFADHAVSVARQVIYLVTGEWEHRADPADPA